MYTNENSDLHYSCPSLDLLVRRALRKEFCRQIESKLNLLEDTALGKGDGLEDRSTNNSFHSKSLHQLWQNCLLLQQVLNSNNEEAVSQKNSSTTKKSCHNLNSMNVTSGKITPIQLYTALKDTPVYKPKYSKNAPWTLVAKSDNNEIKGKKSFKFSRSTKFNNENNNDNLNENAVSVQVSVSEKSKEKEPKQNNWNNLSWISKTAKRFKIKKNSKSSQYQELVTIDKVLQTPVEENDLVNGIVKLKNRFEVCAKCGKVDPEKMSNSDIDTIKMLIKMEAKQNYRQINLIIRELKEHKHEIRRLNSMFERILVHDCIKKSNSGSSEFNLQEDVKILLDDAPKKYESVEHKEVSKSESVKKKDSLVKKTVISKTVKSTTSNQTSNNKEGSKEKISQKKVPVHSLQKHDQKIPQENPSITDQTPIKKNSQEKGSKGKSKSLLRVKSNPPPSTDTLKEQTTTSSDITKQPSASGSTSKESNSSGLSLFKDHIVYPLTHVNPLISEKNHTQNEIYYFSKKEVYRGAVKNLTESLEQEQIRKRTAKKSSAVIVWFRRLQENNEKPTMSESETSQPSTSRRLLTFIKRLYKKSNEPVEQNS